MSRGWSWYVIALVVLNIAGCAWLLWWTARRKPGDPKPEATTHVWDGDITEYNKPLPRWWINLFTITIVFSIGYLFWYGGWGSLPGYGSWSSRSEYAREKAAGDARINKTLAPYSDQPIQILARNVTAVALGRSIFINRCATCHGSSAQGAIGFPKLGDNVWHWGGTPERVLETVLDGREGIMPGWGTALTGMGGPQAIDNVVRYTQKLSGTVQPEHSEAAARGKPQYDTLCVACHGDRGQGDPALGAPSLADDYSLYGSDEQSLRLSIATGRHGVMPAHRQLLGETRSRLVAAYVWSLSNPMATAVDDASDPPVSP